MVIKILSIGIDMEQFCAVLLSPEMTTKAKEIAATYKGRQVLILIFSRGLGSRS
jgi:trehalose-6-phosphate synthase